MMVATATDTVSYLAELADAAFDAFCEDIAGMFDTDMRCERRQAAWGTISSLRERFKKLAAVHLIQADGALNGTFSLLFDQGGVFVLSGVIVMLPELRIREGIKRGSLQDAANLQDAATEAGNLLVGSWDRVFRKECAGHKHFLKTGTFIGKPWESPSPPGFQTEGEALIVLYDMTIEPYPSFQCAAVFPKAVTEGSEDEGQKTEDCGQTTENRNIPPSPSSVPPDSSAEVRPPSSVIPTAPAPDAKPGTEDQGPKAEGGKPKTEDRPPQAEASSVLQSPLSADRPPVTPPQVAPLPPSGDTTAAYWLRVPISQIMEKDVVWAGPDATVQDVIAAMQQHNVGYVLIGQKGVLEGLVSNSNILGAVSVYLRPLFAKWRRPEDDATLGVKVRWIMSRPVRTIRPDATVAAAIESMRRCGGRCLPVVDAEGTVQGIVTVFDLLLRMLEVEGSGSWQGRPPQAPALLL